MSTSQPVRPAVIEHEIRTAATPEQVREALTTDAGLSAWYGAGMSASEPGSGDVVFRVPRHPTFRWKVDRADSAHVAWTCAEGPGRSVGTKVAYECVARSDGRTTVRMTHGGWDEDDDAFRRCNTYWGALLLQLERYLETGERRPVFS